MADIFREVDEALKQERIEKFWHEYKVVIIGGVAALILGTATITAFKSWNASRNAKETARLIEAIESDKPLSAIDIVVENTRDNHEALGLLTKANLLLESGENEGAISVYKEIINNKSVPNDLRDLARLFLVQNSKQTSVDILKPLLSNEKSPWIWHARLEAAAVLAQNNKDYKAALEYLEPFVTNSLLPQSLKMRAIALHHVYMTEQNKIDEVKK